MSSAIGRDLKARNGNFNFDVQVWVKFFSSLLDYFADMIYLTVGDLDIPARIPSHLRTL